MLESINKALIKPLKFSINGAKHDNTILINDVSTLIRFVEVECIWIIKYAMKWLNNDNRITLSDSRIKE